MVNSFCKIGLHLFAFITIQSSFPPVQSISCNFQSNEFVFKLIRKLHSCDQEFLFITSIESLKYLDFTSPLTTSFITCKEFLQNGLASDKMMKNQPKCIIISPELQNIKLFKALVLKVNSSFQQFQNHNKKPTVIFMWPELFPNKSDSLQNLKLQNSFENTRFDIDTDIYTIFTSLNEIPDHCEFSIWETYTIKKIQVIQKLQEQHDNNTYEGLAIEELEIKHPNDHNTLEIWSENELLDNNEILHYEELTNKIRRRSNFRKEIVGASARQDVFQSDWILLKKTKDGYSLNGGAAAYLYWDLMLMLNFTESIVLGDSPITSPNGTLSGKTVSQINSGEADISLAQTLLVPFRAKDLTFVQPTYYGKIHVFFKQPSPNSIRNIVTASFPTKVWITLISTWLFVIVTIKISSHLKTRCMDGHNLDKQDYMFALEVGMWAIAVNCQKSFHLTPSSTGMKLAFIVSSCFGVVSHIAYSAAIVSTLSLNLIPVQNFLDLITYNFAFTVHRKSEPFQDFLDSLIEMYKLPQKIEKVGTAEEVKHLMDPLASKAFLTHPDLFYQTALELNYTEEFICNQISKVTVSDVIYKSGMFLRKGSELTEIFNHKLIKIKERGLNHRYVLEYEKKNILSCEIHFSGARKNGEGDPIKVTDIFTAFLVVFIGFLVAFLFLFYEQVQNRYSFKAKWIYYM